jgi:elongator complex protein 4
MGAFISHRSSDDHCHIFDLSMRVPGSVIEVALQAGNLIYLEVAHGTEKRSTTEVLCKLFDMLISQEVAGSPIRICIPSLGSPFWGSVTSEVIRSLICALLQ